MAWDGRNRRKSSDDCPLTAQQAHEILSCIREMKIDQERLCNSIEMIKKKLEYTDLEEARKKGFKQGAVFWMKAGVAITLISIGSGIILIWSVLTGKISIGDVLKDL